MARYTCTECGARFEAASGVCPDCGSDDCHREDYVPPQPPGDIAARAWPEDDGWQEHSAEDVADWLDWRRDCIEDEQMVRGPV
jgi:predicted ATP-dependent serine protease